MKTVFRIGKLCLSVCFSFLLVSCSTETPTDEGITLLGRYRADYDAQLGVVSVTRISPTSDLSNSSAGPRFLMNYGNASTGTIWEAIRVHPNYECDINGRNSVVGLVDPDNCDAQTNYNPATSVLSFYTQLINKSNLPNNFDGTPIPCPAGTPTPTAWEYTCPTGAEPGCGGTSFPPNTTFYAPFYLKLLGFNSWGSGQLVTSVNTDLPGAECGANGLTLTNDDDNGNNYFDCIYPDQAFSWTDASDPGWNFTPYVGTNLRLTPGDSTGCVVFLQFQLATNENFTFFYDLLGIKDDGALPDAPIVTSPADNAYVSGNPVNLTGTCVAGGTVSVEGGDSSVLPYPRTALCDGTGAFTASVQLKANQTNNLVIYQTVAGKQGKPVALTLLHDNQAPSLVYTSPVQGETSVDRNTNCFFTFNEPMTTPFAAPASCASPFTMCTGANTWVAGTITYSPDKTQAIYTPTTKPLTGNTSYRCIGTTALTDLAGNALPSTTTITFTTAQNVTDTTPPFVRGMFPPDNAYVSPATDFSIVFSEAINPATVHVNGVPVIDATCSTAVPNIAVFQLSSCSGSPQPIAGTLSMSGDQTTVTFIPDSSPIPGSPNCYGFLVSSCVKDLAGLSLANRGTRTIGAYNATVNYNTYNIFFPNSGDSTSPTLVHVGPPLNAVSVNQPVYPFVVFDEPINSSTIISDYFFLTKFGSATRIPLSLQNDPTLQMITYRPYAPLNTTLTAKHVITVTGAVTDMAGNIMGAPQTSQFDVTSTADTTAPTVVGVTPSNPTTLPNVSLCTMFDVDFSEPMKTNTLNNNNLKLIQVGTGVEKGSSMVVSDDAMHVRLIPDSSLGPTAPANVVFTGRLTNGSPTISSVSSFTGLYVGQTLAHQRIPAGTTIVSLNPGASTITMSANATRNVASASITASGCGTQNPYCGYQVTGSTGLQDRVGNTLASAYTSATYWPVTETTRPSVSAVAPVSGSTIAQNASVAIFFNEAMDKSTLNATNIVLSNCNPAPGILFVSEDGRMVVANCINQMSPGAASLAFTATAIKDYYNANGNASCEANTGNTLNTYATATYTVASPNDTTAPTISALSDVYPQDNAGSIATSVQPYVTFSEEIDPRTIMVSSLFLMDQYGNLANTVLEISTTAPNIAKRVTIKPVSPLATNTKYYIVATTAIRDLRGGNTYDGNGGESTVSPNIDDPGVLRTCFATGTATCP